MKILTVGDIVGKTGIQKLKEVLPNLIKSNNIDFIIVNGENAADGMGLTEKMFKDMLALGVSVVTMGNHTWGKKEIFQFINNKSIIRPANYSSNNPGRGYDIYECNGKRIGVINLIGRTSMSVLSDNPFTVIDDILEKIKNETDIIFVDFHAEATAEKIAMSYYLDGRVTAVFGTHTHVQTADETILEKGTAYITDIGMTGPKKSVIGMDVDVSIKRFLTSLPEKYKVAEDSGKFNGCIFEIDDEKNKVTNIIRIQK